MGYYCEYCWEEDLKKHIELFDGTIVCNNNCKRKWLESCIENRKSDWE